MGCTPRAHILPTDFSCLGIYQNVNAVYLFKSREGINKPISRSMAYKILRAAAEYVGLDDIGTHAEGKHSGTIFTSKQKMLPCCRRFSITRTSGQPFDTLESIRMP